MNKKGVFRLLSFFTIFALLIGTVAFTAEDNVTLSKNTIYQTGSGLTAIDTVNLGGKNPVPGSTRGSGWTAEGWTGSPSTQATQQNLYYPGLTAGPANNTTAYYGRLGGSGAVQRQLETMQYAEKQPIWISYVFKPDIGTTNGWAYTVFGTQNGTNNIEAFAHIKATPVGNVNADSHWSLASGDYVSNLIGSMPLSSTTKKNVLKSTSFIIVKLDGTKMSVWVNPVILEPDLEANPDAPPREFEGEGENGFKFVDVEPDPEHPEVKPAGKPDGEITLDKPIKFDCFKIGGTGGINFAYVRVGYSLNSVVNLSSTAAPSVAGGYKKIVETAKFANPVGTPITVLGSEESVTANFAVNPNYNFENPTPVAVVVATYGEYDLLNCKVKFIDDIGDPSLAGKISETINVDGSVRKVRAFVVENFSDIRSITGTANEIVRPSLDD